MSRFHSYINSAASIVESYQGEMPLSVFLKQYFSARRSIGGSDRKWISALCYGFFRLGHFQTGLPVKERIALAAALFPQDTFQLPASLVETYTTHIHTDIRADHPSFPDQVFPYASLLSPGVHPHDFVKRFFSRPPVFLRVRPGREAAVQSTLSKNGITAEWIKKDCLKLPSGVSLDQYLKPDEWVVVQDRSSRQTGVILAEKLKHLQYDAFHVWDCCAASGGKTIMLQDLFPKAMVTVTDIRDRILHNLRQRCKQAGVSVYHSALADLTLPLKKINGAPFRLILADVPCTGSGTWARTPEQLFYFKPDEIASYTKKQRSIINNVIPHLAPGGYLAYITCSVFREENESAAEYIQQTFPVNCLYSGIITGYESGADSMYLALFQHQG